MITTKNKSVSRKILLSISSLIILLLITNGFLWFTSISKSVEATIGNYSTGSAKLIADSIDGEAYAQFLKNPVESVVYREIRRKFNDFRVKTGALYVYTMAVKNGEDVKIMVDGQPEDSDLRRYHSDNL